MESATKRIYVLVGLPFSGKSTYCKQLAPQGECLLIERDTFLEEINNDPETLVRLNEEAMSIEDPVSRMSTDMHRNAFNDALTLEYCRRVVQAITQSSAPTVIVDGTHLQRLSRSFVRELRDAHMTAVVFPTDTALSIKRLQITTLNGVRATVTPEMIQRMSEIYESPTIEEGFDEIILP